MVSLGERASFKPLYINKAEVIQGGEADPVVCITLTSILYECKSNALYLSSSQCSLFTLLIVLFNDLTMFIFIYSLR